jgi:hypothetical protein
MKRVGIQRKTPMKRGGFLKRKTPLRQKGKASISKAKAEAWKWCSRFIRLRDRIPGTETAACVTCGNVYPIYGKGCIQAGHAFGGRGNGILYATDAIYSQCHICNFWKRGEYVKFEMFLRTKLSAGVIEDIKQNCLKTIPMSAQEHLEVAEMFKRKCEELGGWKE